MRYLNEMSNAAIYYRSVGIITHPLTSPKDRGKSPGKKPIIRDWSNLTTSPTDEQIKNFYEKSDHNIGAVCGKASNLVVLDVDWYIRGMWDQILSGVDTSQWIRQYRTDGRWHWLFTFDENAKLSHEKPLGFDILANGGNVVMAPSIHEEGETYCIEGEITKRTPVPDDVLRRINGFVGVYSDLYRLFGKCRRTFLNMFNAFFVNWESEYYRRLEYFRGADGRTRTLAMFAELKANGATDQQLMLLCMMVFGDSFDYNLSLESINHIGDDKTFKTDTILADPVMSQFYEKKDGIEDEYKNYYTVEVLKSGKAVIKLNISGIADGVTKRLNVISFADSLYVYTDGYYIEGLSRVKQVIQEIAKTVRYVGPLKRVTDEIIHYIMYESPYFEYPFNQYTDVLPVNNGLLKIDFDDQSCELIPHDPSYFFTYKFPVDYSSTNDGSIIHDEVIKEYVEGDDSDMLYQIPAQALLQALGCAPFKKAYILQGDPNAGKSSYLELLLRCFGQRNISGESLQALGSSRFSTSNLEGKIINAYDDLSDIPLNNCGVFKTLTGKHEHTVEQKGVQGYTAHIYAVHLFTCNSPPTFDKRVKNDTAFWERWEYIHFPYVFGVDPFFYNRVFTEDNVSGFFSRVLKTLMKIKSHGLTVKSTASEVRERWSYNSDPLYQFLQESVEFGRGHMYVEKDAFIDCVRRWCLSNDVDMEKVPSTKTGFTQALDKYEIYSKRVTNNVGIQVQAYEIPGMWQDGAAFTASRILQRTEQSTMN